MWIRPKLPSRINLRTSCHWGWCRTIKASATSGPFGAVLSKFRLGGGQRNRLFAQHLFARSHCRDRHRHMEVIGQRVVDGLDIGVVQEVLIGAIGLWNSERLCKRIGLRSRPRPYRHNAYVRAFHHARNDPFPGKFGGPKHSPADWFHSRQLTHRPFRVTE